MFQKDNVLVLSIGQTSPCSYTRISSPPVAAFAHSDDPRQPLTPRPTRVPTLCTHRGLIAVAGAAHFPPPARGTRAPAGEEMPQCCSMARLQARVARERLRSEAAMHFLPVCASMVEARRLFDQSHVRDLESWNTLIGEYVRKRRTGCRLCRCAGGWHRMGK
jgi:hypothetical protein